MQLHPEIVKCYAEVLLYTGTTPIDLAIRWQSRSHYSHAAISSRTVDVDGKPSRGLIYESTCKTGVRLRKRQPRDDAARSLFVEITFEQRLEMLQWLGEQVGKKYDLLSVMRFVSRRKGNGHGLVERWFCSELAFAALEKIGKAPFVHTKAWEVPPGWLDRSVIFEEGCPPCLLAPSA